MVMHSHDFNPRSSCEERRALKGIIVQFDLFQSTLLMRGATTVATKDVDAMLFQSTLLMRGATLCRHPVTAV